MDILGIWYALTLLGTPEYWGFASLALLAVYFVLRYLIPENPTWKKFKPAFRKFLLVFLPSILIVFIIILSLKTFWYVQRPCTVCLNSQNDGMFQLEQAVGPDVCNPFCDTDSSFPSGHSGTIFVVFSSLYLTFRKRSLLPLSIIPVLVSYSRIVLGVHTWIDVLAGAFLGLFLPVLVSIIIQKKHKSR